MKIHLMALLLLASQIIYAAEKSSNSASSSSPSVSASSVQESDGFGDTSSLEHYTWFSPLEKAETVISYAQKHPLTNNATNQTIYTEAVVEVMKDTSIIPALKLAEAFKQHNIKLEKPKHRKIFNSYLKQERNNLINRYKKLPEEIYRITCLAESILADEDNDHTDPEKYHPKNLDQTLKEKAAEKDKENKKALEQASTSSTGATSSSSTNSATLPSTTQATTKWWRGFFSPDGP